MPGHYTKEELDRLDKHALIMLLMSMQDQFQQMNDLAEPSDRADRSCEPVPLRPPFRKDG